MSIASPEARTDTRPQSAAVPAAPRWSATGTAPEGAPRPGLRRRVAAPWTMLGVVLAGICAPLLRAPTFYYWDDTAGASVGAWRHTADALLDGQLPLLSLELWRGGNYAAEAAFGMFNPLLLGLYVATASIDDLAMVALVIKAFFFLTMALGVYLLCREYGVRPWPAALTGTMLPLSGFTIWMDGASWVTGLTVSALTPWVWWTVKRGAEGHGSLLWAILAGYLCASAGNPYGLLSAGLVVAAVLVETFARRGVRHTRRVVSVGVAGTAVALLAVGTYLPFVLTSSVSYRAGSGTYNDEFLSPGLSDVVGLSSPSFQPYVMVFGELSFSFPALYLSWLVLPLLPWLRWSTLPHHGRKLTAAYALGTANLLIVIGPSQIGFFRWPVRLLPYLWLSVLVVFAVLLSAGLHRDRARQRWAVSAGAVIAGFWLAWSDVPDQWDRHLVSAVMVLVLLVMAVRAARYSQRRLALTAMGGTLAVLVVQLSWMPVNANVTDYSFPRSEASIEERFADYRPGLTVQIAALSALSPDSLRDQAVYDDVLFGSMYAVADVESLTAYSGVGFNALDGAQCMDYQGSTCGNAWAQLWVELPGTDVVLADLLRARTVVVQRSLLDIGADGAPEGWELRESTPHVTVWQRIEPLPWPDGRLSSVSGPLTVTSDVRTGDVGETVEFRRDAAGAARLTFARLAWPGYRAEVDGMPVPVAEGPGGLLVVELPEDVPDGTLSLSWSPPGATVSVVAASIGMVAAAGLGLSELRRRGPAVGRGAGSGSAVRATRTREN
ncbi:MAG: hypothetical protein ACLGI3_17610 [Actinomycetes bacterium]